MTKREKRKFKKRKKREKRIRQAKHRARYGGKRPGGEIVWDLAAYRRWMANWAFNLKKSA